MVTDGRRSAIASGIFIASAISMMLMQFGAPVRWKLVDQLPHAVEFREDVVTGVQFNSTQALNYVTSTEKFLFLDSSWEQFFAGKNTLRDFVYISMVSSRRPVIPYLGIGEEAFVGLPNGNGSSGQPLDNFVSLNYPYVQWEHFGPAHRACKDRIRIASIVRSIENINCTGDAKVLQNMVEWGASKVDCLESQSMDVKYFEDTPECIVLSSFIGLHHGRGKLSLEHSTNASRLHNRWVEAENILQKEYSHLQYSSDLTPSPNFLIKAAECGEIWGKVFDVLQYRAEKLCIYLNKGRLRDRHEQQQSFCELCVNHTIDELEKLREPDSAVPILLLHDLGGQGSQSDVSCSNIFPLSRLDEIVKSRFRKASVHFSTQCPIFESCRGPPCIFFDMAIFLQARHVVQLSPGSASAEALRIPRSHAGRKTTVVFPNDFSQVWCPYTRKEL